MIQLEESIKKAKRNSRNSKTILDPSNDGIREDIMK